MTLEEKIKNIGDNDLKLSENEYFLIYKPTINKSFTVQNGLNTLFKIFSDNSETKIIKKYTIKQTKISAEDFKKHTFHIRKIITNDGCDVKKINYLNGKNYFALFTDFKTALIAKIILNEDMKNRKINLLNKEIEKTKIKFKLTDDVYEDISNKYPELFI